MGMTSFSSVVDSAPSIQNAYFTPFVIRDSIDFTKLVLFCDCENIRELKINLFLLVSEQNPIILRDDGKNGDDTANDNYFTKDSLLFGVGIDYYTNVNFRSAEITFIYKDGTEEQSNLTSVLKLTIINPGVFPIPDIKRSLVDPDIDNTDYVISIKNSYTSNNELTKTFFKYFEDSKDFFAIVYPYNKIVDVSAYFQTISNNISGIGLDSFDFSQLWGSNNRLQGVITFYNTPGPGTFNHELLHRWAVYLNPQFNLACGVHWSALVANTSGFGFGSLVSSGVYRKLEYLSENNYRALPLDYNEPSKYNDIELYLMGLKDQITIKDPLKSLINPISLGFVNENGIRYELISASGISITNFDDIIKIHGSRNPSYLSAQRNFRMALIVSCYRSLTDVEFALYDYIAKEYEKSKSDFGLTFHSATSGLAEMNSRIISIGDKLQLVSPDPYAEIPLNNISFSWHKINSAVNYRFQLSAAYDFSDKILDSLKSDTSLVIKISNIPGQYFWRVKAINNDGESYWSEIRSFTVFNALLSVLPGNMDVGSDSGNTTFSISSNTSWSVSDNADWLTSSPASGSGDGTLTATFTANTLSTTRIGTITVSATGLTPQNVNVTQSASTDIFSLKNAQLLIYPNPTRGIVYIQFDKSLIFNIKISILGLTGNSLSVKEYEYLDRRDRMKIDLSFLGRGIYFLVIENGNSIRSYKIVRE